MGKEITYIISNEFEKEVIVFNTVTCLRLFQLGNDPTLLYMFYVKTAKIQGTNSIYAVNSFCKKGLGWGDHRFNAAKKLLTENGLIENVVRKDENNKITGHYIRIHYLQNNTQEKKASGALSHKVDSARHWAEPACGCQETNAFNKKENTNNKKENASNKKQTIGPDAKGHSADDYTDIFNHWNTEKIIVHRKLTPITKGLITRAFNFGFSTQQIKEAITNYSKILHSEEYQFNYKWNLGEFISRGVSPDGLEYKKGFQMFFPENDPFNKLPKIKKEKELSLIEILRNDFTPLTVEYSPTNLLDKVRGTYFGFYTDRLRDSRLIEDYTYEIKENYGIRYFEFGDFCWLEEVIASIFFNRKAGYDMDLLQEFMRIWKEKKSEYKQSAIEKLEWGLG